MRRNPAWRGYRAVTLAAGGLMAAAAGWLAVCHWGDVDRGACLVGVAQRVLLGVWDVWLGVIAVRLWREAP